MLLYGAAGALGQIMVPWAKHLGAFVIGVVSKPESVERAKAAGCDAVLVFDAATLAAQVAELTGGEKVDVVYDPIGQVSFEDSLDSLRPLGLMVSFGMASGAPAPVEVSTLNAKDWWPASCAITAESSALHPPTCNAVASRTLRQTSPLTIAWVSPGCSRTRNGS